MQNISAHDAKTRFAQLLDTTRREPVVIERHGRTVAVVLSKGEYDELNDIKLRQLRAEMNGGSRTSSAVPTPITRLTSYRSSPSGSRPLAASDSRRSDLPAFCPGGGGFRRHLGLLRRTVEP